MQVAVGFQHRHGWTPVSDVLLTEGICVTDLDGCLRVQGQGHALSITNWEMFAQKLPGQEHPDTKASHLSAVLFYLHPVNPSVARGGSQPPALASVGDGL